MLVISFGRSARFVSFLYCRNTRPMESSTETHRFVRNVRQGHRAARQQQDAPNSTAGRELPSGLSNVLLGVRTTGRLLLCLPPRRNPVLDVSTSDMMPGSSSNNIVEEGGGYPRGRGDWKNNRTVRGSAPLWQILYARFNPRKRLSRTGMPSCGGGEEHIEELPFSGETWSPSVSGVGYTETHTQK